MDLVTQSAQKAVASQLAVRLHVADHRCDRVSAVSAPFSSAASALVCSADQHLRRFQFVATVAAINKSPLDRLPGDPLNLCGRPPARVWPSHGLPGSACMPTIKLSRLLTAALTLTPNSNFLCALHLPMHSTSGACRL